MVDNLVLYNKLASLPDNLKSEVEDFIDFLKSKTENEPQKQKPVFGCMKGMFIMSPDFDEPLEDFKEYME